MPKTQEHYNLEKAREEASLMQEKIKSGEARDYSGAEKLAELEKNRFTQYEKGDWTLKIWGDKENLKWEMDKFNSRTGEGLHASPDIYPNLVELRVEGGKYVFEAKPYMGQDGPDKVRKEGVVIKTDIPEDYKFFKKNPNK